MRDGRVVDEHVQAAKLLAHTRRGDGNRGLIGHIELQRVGVAVDRLRRLRADEHGEALRG